jgi:branched-chain amino acid transport system substrate-binding protein
MTTWFMRGRHAVCAALSILGLSILPGHLAAQSSDIVIGQSVVLSGPMAANGLLYAQGIGLQFDAINARGGISGRKLRLVVVDDAYNADKCKANTERFLGTDGVVALLGYAGTGPTMACAPLAEQARVPLVAPLTGAPELRNGDARYLFHVRASYVDEMKQMVRHLTTVGVRNIAIAYQDDPFGRSGLKSAELAMAGFGLEPAAVGAIVAGTYDATQAAADVAATDPAAVILASAGTASVNFIRAYRALGKRAQFFGLSVVSSNQLVEELGDDADGVVISQVVPPPTSRSWQIVREFQRDIETTGRDVEVNHTTLEGYIAAKVLIEAIRRAGGTITPERIVQGLESMSDFSIGGFEVSFGPDRRAGSRYVELSMVRSTGRFVH